MTVFFSFFVDEPLPSGRPKQLRVHGFRDGYHTVVSSDLLVVLNLSIFFVFIRKIALELFLSSSGSLYLSLSLSVRHAGTQ
jgi:hypothetical protein